MRRCQMAICGSGTPHDSTEHLMGSNGRTYGSKACIRTILVACNVRWCLILSFSCSLGSFNTLSTLAAQLVAPFGYSADDASIFGVAVTVCGVLGALVMSVLVGLTGKHKAVLSLCCVFCVLFAALAALTVIYVGHGSGGMQLLLLAFAGLGFSATPLMPISFEAAVVVGHPTGEGTLAGLCMSGGQILGIGSLAMLGMS